MNSTIQSPLSTRQQCWLKHLHACEAANMTTIDYAREHGLAGPAGLCHHPDGCNHGAGSHRELARTTEMSPEERKLYRQRHAAPILAKVRTWLDADLPNLPWSLKKILDEA